MTTFVEQVGGSHYKADYQHWDLALDIEMGPLEYAATKYVTRWRKKDGPQGLKKAISYIDKLMYSYADDTLLVRTQAARSHLSDNSVEEHLKRFFTNNDITSIEARVIQLVCTWSTVSDLRIAKTYLLDLLKEAEASEASSSYVDQ